MTVVAVISRVSWISAGFFLCVARLAHYGLFVGFVACRHNRRKPYNFITNVGSGSERVVSLSRIALLFS